MTHQHSSIKPLISDEVVIKWQGILDLIAQKLGVPASRITRIESLQLEIFVTSATEGNPYRKGEGLKLDGRIYCGSVILNDAPLLVPTAQYDPKWNNKPDKALGMISYLGFPLHWPDGEIFGTLCVFDSKENHYSDEHRDLLAEFKLVIESDLKKLDTANPVASDDSKLWHAIQSAAMESILVMDTQGTFLSVNEIGASRFGVTSDELIGKNLYDIVPSEVAASRKKNISEVIRSKRVMRFDDFRQGRYFDFTIYPVLNEQNDVEKLVVFAADITERKTTRQALVESERKYRELVDEAATIILRWDIKGNVTFFNEYAQKFFGFPEKDILGKNVVGTIVPETEFTGRDLALLMEEICKDPARFEDNENENIKRNGERVWIAWKNRPIYNKRGELFEIHSVGIDITARKQAEEALRQSEARWRSITENSPDHIIMVNREGNILSINYAVPDLTIDQVIGTHITNYLPPDYKQVANDCLAQVWATGNSGQFTVEYQDADGGQLYYEANVGPVKDSGETVALIVSARNITERRKVQDALRASEERLRLLVGQADFILWSVDKDLKFTSSLGGGLHEIGLQPNQVVKAGMDLFEFFQTDSPELQPIKAHFQALAGQSVIYEDEWQGRHFQTQVNPQKDPEGNIIGCVGVAIDITQRKQAEKVLQRSETLELLATGASLQQILSALVMSAENRSPNMLCSVLLMDEEGRHLLHGAAPGLPDFYNEAIDGIEVGPTTGSCGAAAFTGERVIVEDVMTHPNWENYRTLAGKAGLRACWSEPILSTSGKVLGTFAIYYHEPRAPGQSDLEYITDSARLAGIAIERKQAEEKILASESELRGILDSLREVYYRADLDGNLIRISPSAEQVFGYAPGELLGRPTTIFWRYPEKRQEMLEAMRAGGGAVHLFEVESVRKDGSFLWASINSHFYYDEQGNIAGVEGTIRDVSVRKRAEQELLHQKALFEAVFRDVPDAMAITNVNRELMMCNPAMTRIFGYQPEEIIGKRTLVLYESEEEYERQGSERYNLTAEEKIKPYTINYKRKNGEVFPGETVGTPIRDESGSTIAFMGVIRDITDRQLAEQELKRSRQHFQYLDRLSRIISQAPNLNSLLGSVLKEMLEIFSVDRAWLFYPADPEAASWKVPMEVTRKGYPGAFELNLDIPNNSVISTAIRDALDTDGPVIHDFFRWEEVPEVIQRFNIKTHMIIALHPKIDKPWILGLHQCSHNREWTDSDKRLFPDIAERMTSALTNRLLLQQLETDIAQRKRAEEQARLHQAELAHMARLNIMGEMATGIAHELNQPLTAIANYAAVGSEIVGAGNENSDKLLKALDSVQVQAERASEIIRRLRQFVKKQSPQRINVSINTLVKDVVSFMEVETRKQNIQTQLNLAAELPLVFADAIQIEQVLLNIIRNSLDAMRIAGIEEPKLTISTYVNGDGNVHVDVSDTGPGIDEVTLGNIFEPFVTTKGAKGMGMGLSISRSIIEAHGGKLWAESKVGRGTTFYFTLPVIVGETL
ncbi:PAS domain S-box protein [Kaarinaea lacus]